jgi:hypothetical protein
MENENKKMNYITLGTPIIEVQKEGKFITTINPYEATLVNLDGDNLLLIEAQFIENGVGDLTESESYDIKLRTLKIMYPYNLKTDKMEVTFDLHNMKLNSTMINKYKINCGSAKLFAFYDGNNKTVSTIIMNMAFSNDIQEERIREIVKEELNILKESVRHEN